MDNPNDDPKFFATTHWSVVLRAGAEDDASSTEALQALFETYWFPLYAYARKLGQTEETAKDSTQGFFVKLLEKNYLGIADRRRGRFRWFLLTAFKGYLANEWDRQNALKRGGGQRLISLDQSAAEARYDLEPSHADTPNLVFEKRWALELISNARERLRAEMEDSGKSDRFALLEQKLPGGANDLSYEDIAERIDSTPAAVKQSVHRLKSRYRDLIREEVAKTVASPEEVDEEIAYLMDILGKS